MLFFKKKKSDPSQPHPDWPWVLTVGGMPRSNFDWADIQAELRRLYPDNDSFLILEQKDPEDRKKYWYIQSAIALAGPNQGKYIVGCGWSGESGPVLMERCYAGPDDVTAIFETAFQRKPLDLSGYENFEL